MGLRELRQQHTQAAEHYLEKVTELQRMQSAGVPRQELHAFWRDSVDPAATAARSTRLALSKARTRDTEQERMRVARRRLNDLLRTDRIPDELKG